MSHDATLLKDKSTEIGTIPSDWDVKPISELFEVTAGGDWDRMNSSRYEQGPYRYPIYANALRNDGVQGYCKYWKIPGESLTITGRGDVGKAVYRPRPFVPIVRLLALVPRNSSAKFYAEYINSKVSFALESTGVPQLTAPQVKPLLVPVPPVEEQYAIANALTQVDSLVTALERLIVKKEAIRDGMMQQLLTGKTRLEGFSGEWLSLHVASKSTLRARIGWQGLTTSEYKTTGHFRLVGGTEFFDGSVDWGRTPFVDQWRYEQDAGIQVREGDVLLTKDGTIGKTAYVDHLPGPATLNSGVFVIRPTRNAYDSRFLYYVLRSRAFEEFLSRLTAGSTISHLYQRDLVGLVINAPATLEEQAAIASALGDADSEIRALRLQLSKTKSLKRGMTQELLSGRTRLANQDGSPDRQKEHQS
ncbi:restriction endonuclease subunit S [Paenarthrobacter sp. JL.01a]|uniref:restriction endonuclease subunit S n=1 Tax=Paenarthrobacter sp. JL.01a TaxID=2979324 RepID=UPI0021C60DEF|nr:restriction endonuclease subunit S [Paenarthrobacter sp. JL.01a]UXM91012.1 restriction endonuclease subunit S [Paenarthrobacter sp. JL.01a]